MTDLFETIDRLIATSQKAQTELPKSGTGRWKYCVALASKGWEAYGYEKVGEPHANELVIKWKKRGEKDIRIRLTFVEQCLWVDYLEKNNG